MAQFYTDDVCAFKSDPFIVGTVEHTWRDVDGEFYDSLHCYRDHATTPDTLWDDLVYNRRPPIGYVVLSFAQPHDMFALVSESSLILVDRALAAGDIVKKKLSDAQSGTIISTSIKCGLRPTCSTSKYAERSPRKAHGLCAIGFHEARDKQDHCSPFCRPLDRPNSHAPLNDELHGIPAQELKYWNHYREQDYVIYKDWVGRIRDVLDEVAVRLTDGSVVVVDDPGELRQPYWVEGSDSKRLHERLIHLNYEQPVNRNITSGKPRDCVAEPCYPGQIVHTTKGNLRRGHWKFGVYDPNITPQGIVVDVRTTEIVVDWTLPNVFHPNRAQKEPPPLSLKVDALDSSEITTYDHSKKPRETMDHQLPGASHSPDTGFGHHVRFKDPAGTALKYDGSQKSHASTTDGFHRIPRTTTQGFDMNVFQVSRTHTKVVVQWQDGTLGQEDSVALIPYNNIDEQEVWPGDYVSLQAEEEMNKDADTITCHKIGIVQYVQANDRIAKVRWFADAVATTSIEDKSLKFSPTYFAPISDEYSIVSLYEVACHPALGITRGDLVIPVPAQLPHSETILLESNPDVKIILREAYENSSRSTRPNALLESSAGPRPDEQRTTPSDDIRWFGEIVDVHSDGDVSVRLGAASDVRDIKIPIERCVFVTNASRGLDMSEPSEDEDSNDESIDSWMNEDMSDSDIDFANSGRAIAMEIEYEGGNRIDDGSDDEMWSTEDEEMKPESVPLAPEFMMDEPHPNPIPTNDSMEVPEDAQTSLQATEIKEPQDPTMPSAAPSPASSTYTSMPAQSVLLEGDPPTDHRFINTPSNLAAPVLRRVMKEHRIMHSSLPENVFVRTWESRLDLLRVLIVGPQDTPYELAPFVFDFHFTNSFPERPPDAFFQSWTEGRGRINPNLYEDGTICLSLLGTWPGEGGKDTWSSSGSTILQLIVSLLGLVLVREPFYNEAGFEVLANTDESRTTSALYTERAFVLARGFVLRALTAKPGGVADILAWLYESRPGPRLLRTVIEEGKSRIDDGAEKGTPEAKQPKKLSRGASIMLERTLASLEAYQQRLEAAAE